MKAECVQFLLFFAAATLAAAAQDASPAFYGVKAPFLAGVAVYAARSFSLPRALCWCAACGALYEALGGLPLFCGIAVFAGVGALAHWTARNFGGVPFVHGAGLAAGVEIGLALADVGVEEPLAARLTAAAALGGMTAWIVCGALAWCEKRAGVDAAAEPALHGKEAA